MTYLPIILVFSSLSSIWIMLSSSVSSSVSKAFHWTYTYEFRQNEEDCLDARYSDPNNVYIEKCHEMGGNQRFEYGKESKNIHHHGTSLCLEVASVGGSNTLTIKSCDPNNKRQKWDLYVNDIMTTPAWANIAKQIDQFKEH